MQKYDVWLGKLKRSWESKALDILSAILAKNLEYAETPFSVPLTSREAVVAQWFKDLAKQSEISMEYDILHADSEACFAHWNASFMRDGVLNELDGIFYVVLNDSDECVLFRQWWVVKEG